MHVGAKKIAAAGLLVAFSVIMLVLSSVIESSSLFFIAAGSFCVGIAIREWGATFGFGFLVSSTILNLFLAPNKIYCFTFGAMGLYLWLSEMLWEKIAAVEAMSHRTLKLWIGKYVIFNLIYAPILFFAPKLLFTGKMNGLAAIILFLLGQVVFPVYDVAYRYFQGRIWGALRVRLFER